MYWTLELASYLEDAPWPATKDELIDFAMRTGAPLEVVENLQQIEDDEEVFDTIEDFLKGTDTIAYTGGIVKFATAVNVAAGTAGVTVTTGVVSWPWP